MSDPIRLRIVGDGTWPGTRVEDAESGRWLDRVTDLRVQAAPGGLEAIITVSTPAVDLTVPVAAVVHTDKLQEWLKVPRHLPDCDALAGGLCYCGWDLLV